MPLQSDLILAQAKFGSDAISDASKKLNESLIQMMELGPNWYEIGAEKYRQMRWNNETPLPRPPVLEHGRNESIPSREPGRQIPTRVFRPSDGKAKGVFLHIHGGGWVLSSEHYQDGLLDFLSQQGLAVISVGYRLAPEHPFPAGPEDCFDVASYLLANAEKEYGAPLLFVGGESAGAHLAVLTVLHIHASHKDYTFPPSFGLVLHYGCFDLSNFSPSVRHFSAPLIINYDIMVAFRDAFLPNTTSEQRADPSISPISADWPRIAAEMRGRGAKALPAALFTCGTEDALLDDSIFLAAKWQIAGGQAVLKLYTGTPHGFIGFDHKALPAAGEAWKDTEAFLGECLGRM